MKKSGIVICAVLGLALISSACSPKTDAFPKTITAQDGSVSIDVPENWAEYDTGQEEKPALAIQDDGGAFAQVFWFPDVEGTDWTAKDYVGEVEKYYGSNVTGSPDDIETNGHKGYYFAYLKTETEEDTTYTFQGYEFFIDFTGGVIEVDIFFKYTDTAPSNDQLLNLRSIAQTVRIS